MFEAPCSRLAALALATSLGACAPALRGPAAREPMRAPPASYCAVKAGPPAEGALCAAPTPVQPWRQFFASPQLRELLEMAVVNNQDAVIRMQELIIAHNEVSARQGEYWPRLSAKLGVGIDRVGRHTSQGASDEAQGLPRDLGQFQLGVVGSWEADIWGKLRASKKAAVYRYLGSVEGQHFLFTQIVAEVARSYYDLVALDSQLSILAENIRLQEGTLALVRLEKQAARVTELAVRRFEAEVLHFKSRRCRLEQQRVQVENRVNYLLGRYPQPVRREAPDASQLPPSMAAGLPIELLGRRPDVREAELALEAAKMDVKAARAAFYPALRIEAGAGYQAFNARHLFATPASLFYDAVGGLVTPLLNRAAIRAQYESANARQMQAVVRYEQVLLGAFTDVSNQLSAEVNWREMSELLTQEVKTLADAVDISGVLFQAARAEYIEVLTARRDFLEAQMERIEAVNRRFQTMVNLYQALGGGWQP